MNSIIEAHAEYIYSVAESSPFPSLIVIGRQLLLDNKIREESEYITPEGRFQQDVMPAVVAKLKGRQPGKGCTSDEEPDHHQDFFDSSKYNYHNSSI